MSTERISTVPREQIKNILLLIFRSWQLQQDSRNPETGEYGKEAEEAATQVAGGDELIGATLPLFSYWDNDLISIAAHYGIGVTMYGDGRINIDLNIPPAPSPTHYWDAEHSQWLAPEPDPTDVDAQALAPTPQPARGTCCEGL